MSRREDECDPCLNFSDSSSHCWRFLPAINFVAHAHSNLVCIRRLCIEARAKQGFRHSFGFIIKLPTAVANALSSFTREDPPTTIILNDYFEIKDDYAFHFRVSIDYYLYLRDIY